MVPALKAGGGLIISFQRSYQVCFSPGLIQQPTISSESNLCGSMFISVSLDIQWMQKFFLKLHVLNLLGFVQFLQFRYQQGCLYRLKALGERHDMDITIEGFHSWMWRGLSFLLPFLFVGYFFELYNAYALYKLMAHPESEWQVLETWLSLITVYLPSLVIEVINFMRWVTSLNGVIAGRCPSYFVPHALPGQQLDNKYGHSAETGRQSSPQVSLYSTW